MRIGYSIITMVLLMILVGCSGGGNNPVSPDDQPLSIEPQSDITYGDCQIMFEGTMNLNDGTVEVRDRSANPYLDVTPFVGSYFSYEIQGVIPPDILNIQLNLYNPSTITAYDVAIVFDNLYGKTVLMPDAQIDIFGEYDIDPVVYFRSEADFVFPPDVADSEYVYIQYPGGSPLVDFFIIAHLGGHTGGVFSRGHSRTGSCLSF